MGLPTVTLTYDFSKINTRRTFTTVNDAMGFTFFTLWRYLIDTMGWTVKYTCDGTTGPTSGSDHTDRLSAVNKCTTRGTSTAAAQSFGVATDGAGADHLFAYVGAGVSPTGDDLFYYAFSPTGVYVPAGTSTNTPTATDQVLVSNSLTWVGTVSTDRVLQLFASTDKKVFRLWVYSGGTMQRQVWAERVSSTVIAGWGWTDPLVAGQVAAVAAANAGIAGGPLGSAAGGTQGATGNVYAKISGVIPGIGGGGESYKGTLNASTFTNVNPELQGAAPIVPLVAATNTANVGGKVGNRIDMWFPYSNGIVDGANFGSSPNFQFMYLNCVMVPWDSLNGAILA